MTWKRQTEGSALCASCGNLIGVIDAQCFHCGRHNPAMWGYGGVLRALGRDMGFVKVVIMGSLALFIATLLIDPKGIDTRIGLRFMSPSTAALFLFGASGWTPVFELGRWWTVLSAGWLHGGILHLGFNMMWVTRFGPAVAEYYGAGRMIIIYTASCIVGFVFSSGALELYPYIPFAWFLAPVGLVGAQLTIGASASVSGLIGAILYYANRTGSTSLRQHMIGYIMMFGLFGIVISGVDNQAHLGGFLGGYYISRFMDPLEKERGDHLLIALICIALTALSVVVSVVTGLKFFPAN